MYQRFAHNEYDPWTDGTFIADFWTTLRSLSLLATQLTMRQTTDACPCKVVVPLGGTSMYFVQALPDHRPHWLRYLLASCHLFQAWLNECAPLFSGWLRYTVSDNPKCKLLHVFWLSLFFSSSFLLLHIILIGNIKLKTKPMSQSDYQLREGMIGVKYYSAIWHWQSDLFIFDGFYFF